MLCCSSSDLKLVEFVGDKKSLTSTTGIVCNLLLKLETYVAPHCFREFDVDDCSDVNSAQIEFPVS